MESNTGTPLEIFNQLHECVKKYDADGQAEIFAEQGVWEFPFATGKIPKKVVGRENIRAFGKMAMDRSKKEGRRIVRYGSVNFHQTLDDNTIIVEFELEGEIKSQNVKYRFPFIQLLKVKNGEIVLLRDYFSMEVFKYS